MVGALARWTSHLVVRWRYNLSKLGREMRRSASSFRSAELTKALTLPVPFVMLMRARARMPDPFSCSGWDAMQDR